MITKYLIIVLALIFNSCDQKGSAIIEVKEGTIITNITIISADENKVETFLGFVVIDSEKIVYANQKRPILSGNFNEISGEGKYIIPGLMDSHVHLANTAGFNGPLKNKYPDLLNAY